MSIIVISQTIEDKFNIQSFMGEFKNFVDKNLDDDFYFILNSYSEFTDDYTYYLNYKKISIKLIKLFNLFKFIFHINKKQKITKIYVHQLSIFVIVLFPLRFLGIKLYLWRAHTTDNFISKLSYLLASKIFTTNYITAFPISFIKKKYSYIGQMINTKKFFLKKNEKKFNLNLLYIGRISKIKNLDLVIDYVSTFNKKNKFKLNLDIYGPISYNQKDEKYNIFLKNLINNNGMNDYIKFKNLIERDKIKQLSKKYFFNINFSSGALDKSILELIMLNTLPLVLNNAFSFSFKDIYNEIDSYQSFENKIILFSKMNNEEINNLITLFKIKIELEHSLHNNIHKTFLLS